MPVSDLNKLFSRHLGNQRQKNVPGIFSFSGLSVDAVAGTPGSYEQTAVGAGNGPANSVGQQVAELSKQLNELRTAQQSQIDKTNENTQALANNTATRPAGQSASAGSSILSDILGNALGLTSIVKGVFDLFGGSSSSTPPPLVPFSLPPSITYAAGVNSAGDVNPVDYGQGGQVRSLAPATSGSSTQAAGPLVQIQVNAMDSRSFLDHSDDIARAVRQALLQSNALNDVIADL